VTELEGKWMNELTYKQFIETVGLFREHTISDVSNTPPPTVELHCEQCSRMQPHHTGQYLEKTPAVRASLAGASRLKRYSPEPITRKQVEMGGTETIHNQGLALLYYFCASCKREMAIGVRYDGALFTKFGKWPSKRPKVPIELRGFLKDERAELYKNGVSSYENGYGIGSAAYFRRLVELLIGDLLDEIEGNLFDDDVAREQFAAALEKVRNSHRATDKIAVVKDLVPAVLRSGNMDPIGRLYKALSVDIHHSSDKEALDTAQTIRAALEFVIRKVYQSKRDIEIYSKALRKLEE